MAGLFILETKDDKHGKNLLDALVCRFNHAVGGRVKTISMPPYHLGIVTVGQDPNNYIHVETNSIHIAYGFLDGELISGCFNKLLREAVEKNDQEIFNHLRGHFAGASFFPDQNRLIVFTNRFASVPVYWAETDAMRIWAPEIPACLYTPGISRVSDRVFVAETLLLDAPLGKRTPFISVNHLPPATAAYASPKGVRLKKYWHYHFYSGNYKGTDLKKAKKDDLIDQGVSLFREAVEAVIEPERPTTIFLSGGLDSRTILGFASKKSKLIRTISFGARGSWDLEIGYQVKNVLGIENHESVVLEPWHYIEANELGVQLTGGMLSYPHFHIFNLMRHVGSPNEMVVTGFLGDPHFGADSRLDRQEPGDEASILDSFLLNVGLKRPEFLGLFDEDIISPIRDDLFQIMKECTQYNNPADFHEYYFVAIRQSNFVVMINSLLGMFHEIRMPFVNYDLAEFFCTLPELWRYKRYLQRLVIDRSFPELADIPDADLYVPLLASASQRNWALAKRRLRRAYQLSVEVISNGRFSPTYPREGERHKANLNGPLRQWLLTNLDELEKSSYFPPNALDPFRKRTLAHFRAAANTRLISLATILRLTRRWPTLSPDKPEN